MSELRSPQSWDSYQGSSSQWENLRMREVVYSDLEPEAAEAIEDLIKVRDCAGRHIERVHRLNPQTIEIVWYDDVGDYDEDDDDVDKEPTRVTGTVLNRVHTMLQELFGEHWRVGRKEDNRRGSGRHPQRALIRRADHQRFQYRNESEAQYQLKLHGEPDNAPEGVLRYGGLDSYPEPLSDLVGKDFDCYVFESDTGTKHLVQNGRGNLRNRALSKPLPCACGLEVQPETVIEAERVNHYAEYVTEEVREECQTLRPEHLFDDDLCGRCKQVFTPFRGAQSIRQYAMEVNHD